MKQLRISAISYLNTAPLMWDFEHGEAGTDLDVSYTVPSLCAASLEAGSADVGIIPAAAYATIPDLVILPDVAIASRQAVRSILLVSKVPVESIHTVALDNSSLTSAALMKVLFARWWGGSRSYMSMAPDLGAMLQTSDAALVIGDPALRIDRSRFITCDLAEEWIRCTGKPFVFAFWAARKISVENTDIDLAAIFRRSRDHGLAADSIREIAREWAPRLGLTEEAVKTYLTKSIHYFLDPDCLSGLNLFYRYAAECGALPAPPLLDFFEPRKAAVS
jgi:chorismate dehydratase